MGCGLLQALWHLLCRLSDAGPHFEAKRFLVQRSGRRVQSHARRRESRRTPGRLSLRDSVEANMNSRTLTLGLATFLFAHGACLSQQTATRPSNPWMDVSLSPDLRADLVIKQLTLDEKIQ